jgi:hypothetical protein
VRTGGSAILLACIGIALTLGVVAPSAAGPAPAFGGPKSYGAGRFPVSVAIGLLNGDSKLDLAVANYGASTVSVLLNRGGGHFRAKRDYATGLHPLSVAIGDLNGDGKPDLATANNDGHTISVLLNSGGGSIRAKRDYRTGSSPASVAIGDLNGDHRADLATANEEAGVSVLLNRGDGSFDASRDYATEGGVDSVAIGDLNGDRKPDLATERLVLLNTGDGSFRASDYNRANFNAFSVAVGDLNGDRKPDLVTANLDGDSVSVLLNRGDGSFRAGRDYPTYGRASSVAIGDLNGDGKPDLASADSLGEGENCDEGAGISVTVHANRGDGRFGPWLDNETGCNPLSVAIGNLNDDRKPDIVTANNGANTISVLVNATGRCVVPQLRFSPLRAAKRAITRANCRVGAVRSSYSKVIPRGRVISTTPRAGAVLPKGGKVNLVVSKGRRG